jgi:integrase
LTLETVERLAMLIAERRLRPDDHLFAGRRGGGDASQQLEQTEWVPAVLDAGLKDPLPTERSSRWGGRHLDSSRRGRRVQDGSLAGHRNPSTVHKTYGHLIPQDASPTTDRMSQMRADAGKSRGSVRPPVELDGRRRAGNRRVDCREA